MFVLWSLLIPMLYCYYGVTYLDLIGCMHAYEHLVRHFFLYLLKKFAVFGRLEMRLNVLERNTIFGVQVIFLEMR